MRFSGNCLEIHYRTSAAGSVRVEIQNVAGRSPPGRAAADCREIIGDEIARVVRWKDGSELSHLAQQPVRLRFIIRDAHLFSLQFRGGP